jgi:6-phosphofructokinase 1
MRTREGRKKACFNLVSRGIDRFICIGGDGSLTGANILRAEWPGFMQEFVKEGKITEQQAKAHPHLLVVGMVGSIDNDFCGTDMTIGADSALHRIMESLDAITTTASSHQRTFIVEVMGRNCGFLALSSALASGADFCFIPENPPLGDWKEKMCASLERARQLGRRLNLVIVSEGARDREGKAISSQEIKDVLEQRLGHEPRITILGHVQRGGVPSSYDRLISTLMGAEAVNAVVEAGPETESCVIGIEGNKLVRNPLKATVELTQSVAKAVEGKNFDEAMRLRGPEFTRAWASYLSINKHTPTGLPKEKQHNILVMNIGAPAPGMNATAKAIVRATIARGHNVFASFDGVRGVIDDTIQQLGWIDVDGWSSVGGALLGSNRDCITEKHFAKVAEVLGRLKISGLIIIGGWEGYTSAISMEKARPTHPEFRIPVLCIPAVISNNCPGTWQSIGADTALNTIVKASDVVKQSAVASRCRVFIMEVMGGRCGYLATVASIGAGAHIVYTPESGIGLRQVVEDIESLKERFRKVKTTSLIYNVERTNETYNTDMLTKMFTEEGKGCFEVRALTLGHLQQGDAPSPLDRMHGSESGAFGANFVLDSIEAAVADAEIPCGVIGMPSASVEYIPLAKLIPEMDFTNRRPKHQEWWERYVPVVQGLRSKINVRIVHLNRFHYSLTTFPRRTCLTALTRSSI